MVNDKFAWRVSVAPVILVATLACGAAVEPALAPTTRPVSFPSLSGAADLAVAVEETPVVPSAEQLATQKVELQRLQKETPPGGAPVELVNPTRRLRYTFSRTDRNGRSRVIWTYDHFDYPGERGAPLDFKPLAMKFEGNAFVVVYRDQMYILGEYVRAKQAPGEHNPIQLATRGDSASFAGSLDEGDLEVAIGTGEVLKRFRIVSDGHDQVKWEEIIRSKPAESPLKGK